MGVERYTKLTGAQTRALNESGASRTQILAYLLLSRIHGDKRRDAEERSNPSYCYLSAQMAYQEYEWSKQKTTDALHGLAQKRFRASDGKLYPVIYQVERGHNGKCATYADNAYANAKGYPLIGVGTQTLGPTNVYVGTGIPVPTEGVGTENGVSRYWNPSTQSNTEEDIPGALLAPQAKQSADEVVTKEAGSTNQVSGGARGGTRATIPEKPKLRRGMTHKEVESVTYEDWARVSASVQDKLGKGEMPSQEEWRVYRTGNAKGYPERLRKAQVATEARQETDGRGETSYKKTLCSRCRKPARLVLDDLGEPLEIVCENCGTIRF